MDELFAEAAALEDLCEEAYRLYVDGRPAEATALTAAVVDREFAGEYETWTWVQAILALRGRIGRERGSDAETELYRRRALAAVETGDEGAVRIKRKVHARFLAGAQLRFEQVQAAIDDGDREAELGWRLGLLKDQVQLEAFAADPGAAPPGVTMPAIDALRADIDANLEAIRALSASG